jgi:hypothetical protein
LWIYIHTYAHTYTYINVYNDMTYICTHVGTRRAIQRCKEHLSGTIKRLNWTRVFVDNDVDILEQAQAIHDDMYPVCKLRVQVCSGHDISKTSNLGALESIHPLCRVVMQGIAFETRPRPHRACIQWDETFLFRFRRNLVEESVMQIHVLDYADAHKHIIAMEETYINLEEAAKNPDKWLDLNVTIYDSRRRPSGEVRLRYTYEVKGVRKAAPASSVSKSLSAGVEAVQKLQRILEKINKRMKTIDSMVSFVYIYIYICMYVCMCVCIYVYIYIYSAKNAGNSGEN